MSEPKIKNTMVLVELQDGSIHQVQVKEKTGLNVLSVIAQLEGSINVLEKPIEGLYIEENGTEKGK